jgi:hypothetical protein
MTTETGGTGGGIEPSYTYRTLELLIDRIWLVARAQRSPSTSIARDTIAHDYLVDLKAAIDQIYAGQLPPPPGGEPPANGGEAFLDDLTAALERARAKTQAIRALGCFYAQEYY